MRAVFVFNVCSTAAEEECACLRIYSTWPIQVFFAKVTLRSRIVLVMHHGEFGRHLGSNTAKVTATAMKSTSLVEKLALGGSITFPKLLPKCWVFLAGHPPLSLQELIP